MASQVKDKRTGRSRAHTGTAQLGGILASLNLNSQQHQRQNQTQSQSKANTDNLKMKVPTHLHVPKYTASMMSPLQSPTFTGGTSKPARARINRSRTDERKILSYTSASASASASASSRGDMTSSENSSANTNISSIDVTTPSSKSQSHTLGSETESEATELITGIGLNHLQSPDSSDDEYKDDASSDGDQNEDSDNEHGGEDDTYADASYIVQEDYVPYGRSIGDGDGDGDGERTNDGAGTPCSEDQIDDDNANDHSYANASYIVHEKFVPYGRKVQKKYIDNQDSEEEEGYDSPMALDDDVEENDDTHSHSDDHDDDDTTEYSLEVKDKEEEKEIAQEAIVLNQDSYMDESNSIVSVEIVPQDDDEDEYSSDDNNGHEMDDSESDKNLEVTQESGKVSKRSFSDYKGTSMASTTSPSNTRNLERGNARTLASNSTFTSVSTSTRVRKGKWTMGSRIGQGSFGVVHTAMNNLTGKLMAVKSMNIASSSSNSRTLMNDLRREIDVMKSLQHPNIVRYFGCEMDKQNKVLHIFQEWVPGGSIASLLHKFGPFPLTVVRTYLYQALLGLAYLHKNHILHRDIKGGNILVNDEGVVKLADFGTSKRLQISGNGVVDADDAMANMTMCGTPFFMAPEVFEEKYGRKADVWSCACVAHQMCTATPPWKGLGINGPIKLFSYITKHEGPPPLIMGARDKDNFMDEMEASMNESLANLLEQCFQRDPSKRPSTQTLLDHHFFTECEFNESILEDESIPGGSVIGSRSVLSPISRISPIKLVDLKKVTNQATTAKKVDYCKNEWPAWAKVKAAPIGKKSNPFAK
jgi:serine/threonine protein kinase